MSTPDKGWDVCLGCIDYALFNKINVLGVVVSKVAGGSALADGISVKIIFLKVGSRIGQLFEVWTRIIALLY